MTILPTPSGDLTLGHLLSAAGIQDLSEVLVIRHTYSDEGIRDSQDATVERVRHYVRQQRLATQKFPKSPPRLWVNFIADGGRRARFLTTYDNHGEAVGERDETWRYYDLAPNDLLASLQDRLVIEWSGDTVNWAKGGITAAKLPVVEIADPRVVPFPGFDSLLVSYSELQAVVTDSRYSQWRTALSAVQGIYLIADTSTGKLYVGKADGSEGLFGRWSTYARDGHGSNVALRELAGADTTHPQHFQFSILRVFDPSASLPEVGAAEEHFKQALLSKTPHGLNRN
jgi:hypothetical protein